VEAAIIDGLCARLSQMSVLSVATRRSTAELADCVIFLEAGRVRATGTHNELLAKAPGYADLMHSYDKAPL
jgi:ABC-type multidrug transport system fused ATPase/permease subunit